MTSTTFFIIFIPILSILLLTINLILAPHNPYQEKDSAFECGFHSFLGQNRTQFSVSFFIFALLFLLFDLEILLVYPYSVSGYTNDIYGLIVMLVFFGLLTLGFIFELGKNALSIESKQTSLSNNEDTPQPIVFITLLKSSNLPVVIELLLIDYLKTLLRFCTPCKNIFTLYKNRFLSLFSFDAPKPHGFPSLLLRSTGHGSSNQQPQVPVDRPQGPGITTQPRFDNFYEWRQWSEANGPKYFDIDTKVGNNTATPAEKAWYEENKDRVFDCPSEWKDAPSPVEQPDLFGARELLKDNSFKPEYDEARKKVREAAGMPTTRKETNILENERDRNNFLYPIFSFSIFRFLLPVFHLFSFFFSISVLFIIYLNIDINFVIPYININFLDLTFILLILQFVNLLRKYYKTIGIIKSLVAESNYKEISYILYICIVFIIFIWLIT